MFRHNEDVYEGAPQEYFAKHISREKGLLHLEIKEAILIEGQSPILTMNNRMENRRGRIIRLKANTT